MGVFTYDDEFRSSVSPDKMFKAAILDADNLIPKVRPQAIKHVEIIKGDGGPGTIEKIHFGEGHKYVTMTHRVDAIDKKKLSFCYTVTKGEILTRGVKSIYHELTVVSAPGGGSIYKDISQYLANSVDVCEEHAKYGKEDGTATLKAIEAYILTHPDAY